MSLRARLLVSVLAVVAVGLVAVDVATLTFLQPFLVHQVDDQLPRGRLLFGRFFPDRTGSACFVGPLARVGPGPGGAAAASGAVAVASGPSASASATSVPSVPRPSVPDVLRGSSFVEVLGPTGQVLCQSPSTSRAEGVDPPPKLPADLASRTAAVGGVGHVFTTGATGSSEFHYRVLARALSDGSTIVVARSLSGVDHTLGHLRVIELVATLAALVALAGLAWWLVRIGLRPLDEIGAAAGAIAAGDLSRRVERAEPRTEVGRLGLALNAMLGRIEEAFAERKESEDRLRRFVGDASHELRTPLTSIRGYAELFRRGAADRPVDLERAMRRIEDESTRMGFLVEDLLLLARLDQGRPVERHRLDLGRLTADAVDDARAVEPDRPISFEQPEAPVIVMGDDLRLHQVAGNLLANTRVHTPRATPVSVRVSTFDSRAVLEVADEGPGMTPEVADRVFERFYRADPSRARSHGGTGLGLSIVAAIAEAHGGRAAVTSRTGEGSRFRIELPLATTGDATTLDGS